MPSKSAPTQDEREWNLKQGEPASSLLVELWKNAAASQRELKTAIAKEMGIKPGTVGRYANGYVPIPLDRREELLDCLRAFRWRIDRDWKVATAFSEMLGIDGRAFEDVRKYAFGGQFTKYRIVRFDGSGNVVVGRVVVENLEDQPLIWTYTYDVTSNTGEEIERRFRGPLLKSGKSIYAILAGGTTGKEKYLRVESIWPTSHPEDDVSFGVSLSTYIDRGTPMASPFALLSETYFQSKYVGNAAAQEALTSKLTGMSTRAIISPFAN